MKKLFVLMLVMFLPLTLIAANDPLKRLARDFGKKMKVQKLQKPRVGILTFPYHDGRVSSGSSILSERLTTYFADQPECRVIERSLLKKLLEEQHLGETGVLDTTSAQAIGKILDVDVLITGTLIDTKGNKTELNARAIKADTGEVVAASRALLDRTWPDRPRFAGDVAIRPHPAPAGEDTKDSANEPIMIGYPTGGGKPGRSYK